MSKVSKKTITKRNNTRERNKLIDKFNLETNENKRMDILNKLEDYMD